MKTFSQKDVFFTVTLDQWNSHIQTELASEITHALEKGKIIYFPQLSFSLEPSEQGLLEMNLNPQGAKNISYNPKNQQLGGIQADSQISETIKTMMQRYHQQSSRLLAACCPHYAANECSGRTSFRPVEIKGRKPVSYRKDDTLLHVDAFPSTPVNNLRILRVFTNINPHGQSRSWRVGEPFAQVVERFLPKVRKMWPLEAEILYKIKATRRQRSFYDHCMLQIHNLMKADAHYQKTVPATSIEFPPGSTWIVYTDLVSHAALAGQFVLEQTYYPPIQNMADPGLSPQMQMQASTHFSKNKAAIL